MYYDIVWTRCRTGVDILRNGQKISGDGFHIYGCCPEIYGNGSVDIQLLLNTLQKKHPFSEPALMEDAYLYSVPEFGMRFLEAFHPVPYDLSVTGDFSKRPGMYLNHAIVGEFTDLYPFMLFGKPEVWTWEQKNEAYFYENEAPVMCARKIASTKLDASALNEIMTFVSEGRRELVKQAVAFMITQFCMPTGQRKYLVIKDNTPHDIECWIAAIELAFSQRIASAIPFASRMDKFSSSNYYYANNEGTFSNSQENSSANHKALRAMIVGVVSSDKSTSVRVGVDQPFEIINGIDLTTSLSLNTQHPYYQFVTGYSSEHLDFCTRFLQATSLSEPSGDVISLFSSYKSIIDSNVNSIEEIAEALKFISRVKFRDSKVFNETYKVVYDKSSSLIGLGVLPCLPVLNWLINTADSLKDRVAKDSIIRLITNKVIDAFYEHYGTEKLTSLWNAVSNQSYTQSLSEALFSDDSLDNYSASVRDYQPTDALLYLELYFKTRPFSIDDEGQKIVLSNVIYASLHDADTPSLAKVSEILSSCTDANVAQYIINSVSTYDPEMIDLVCEALVNDSHHENNIKVVLDFSDALHYAHHDEEASYVLGVAIQKMTKPESVSNFADLLAQTNWLNAKKRDDLYQKLDAKINFTDVEAAAKIQNNISSNGTCSNSAHALAKYYILHPLKNISLEETLSEFGRQGFLSSQDATYRKSFISTILSTKLSKDDHILVLHYLFKAPDEYSAEYFSTICNESYWPLWDITMQAISTLPSASLSSIKAILINVFVDTGFKKKDFEEIGKYIRNPSSLSLYQALSQAAIEQSKAVNGNVFTRLFGGRKH